MEKPWEETFFHFRFGEGGSYSPEVDFNLDIIQDSTVFLRPPLLAAIREAVKFKHNQKVFISSHKTQKFSFSRKNSDDKQWAINALLYSSSETYI